MSTTLTLYTSFYLIVSFCFAIRTNEFVSLGLTVENLFDRMLGSEVENFVLYHIKRGCLTLLVHSFIPLGYVIGLDFVTDDGFDSFSGIWWTSFVAFSVLLPSLVVFGLVSWSQNDWERHPIIRNLRMFCEEGVNWKNEMLNIAIEYRRIDKVSIKCSSVARVVVTDNWIFKVSPYNLNIAHQRDSVLVVSSADTHHLSAEGNGAVQYVNIDVRTTKPGLRPFSIRCNALDFDDLKNKTRCPFTILEGITFHKSRMDQFLEAFKETISANPPFEWSAENELDPCIGCMVVQPGVKLNKRCSVSSCQKCHCRPLWCTDCMGKWFASRQQDKRPETWLSCDCTCPVCRSVFCILDIAPLEIK